VNAELRLSLEVFEGPLDLLLFLIRQHELTPSDLRVAEIADQYLNFLENAEQINLDVAGEYLVMAATLAWMKSRLLLPRVETEGDEEVEAVRSELIEKLVAYERFKQAAEKLEDRPLLGRERFGARAEPTGIRTERTLAPVKVYALVNALDKILARVAPQPELMNFVIPKRTLGEGAGALAALFRRRQRVVLTELFADAEDRADVIVRFLALLELIRLGELQVSLSPAAEVAPEQIYVARCRAAEDVPDYGTMIQGAYGTNEDPSDS